MRNKDIKDQISFMSFLCLLALKSGPVLAGIMGNIPDIILFNVSQPSNRPATPRYARIIEKGK